MGHSIKSCVYLVVVLTINTLEYVLLYLVIVVVNLLIYTKIRNAKLKEEREKKKKG